MILISVQDIVKGFGTHEVLKGVSFSLQEGEKMGLVGVNGCGKTTLMRIITGEVEDGGCGGNCSSCGGSCGGAHEHDEDCDCGHCHE